MSFIKAEEKKGEEQVFQKNYACIHFFALRVRCLSSFVIHDMSNAG